MDPLLSRIAFNDFLYCPRRAALEFIKGVWMQHRLTPSARPAPCHA
jgi:hypothetical protein